MILGILLLSGCVKQQINPIPEEMISNQCISELNVFEDKFGINAENISIFGSECSTCSPWYTPEVATFSAILEDADKTYTIFYSNTCPRHAESIVNYRIISSEQDELYNKTKEKICSDFSIYNNYLNECSGTSDALPDINEFTSCVSNYSRYIENNIIDIDKDWKYCSKEGWKDCEKWNSCESMDVTQTSRCTQEYCKMSCLIVYSEERIQKKFIEVCNNWDIFLYGSGGPDHLFSFESPKDIRKIITYTFLK
jgi:hypothetical protein